MSFQAYIDNIKAKTGLSPEDFKKLAKKKGTFGTERQSNANRGLAEERFRPGARTRDGYLRNV